MEWLGFVAIDPENWAERGSDMAHQSYDVTLPDLVIEIQAGWPDAIAVSQHGFEALEIAVLR